jgi:dTMP kinase
VGQGVSAFGDWMVTVALMALVLQLSDSTTAVGGILVLRLLPAVLGGPLAARAARRWDRRRTMLAMDAARAAVVSVIPFVSALWWIYLCAFTVELLSIVFLPARDASVPDLVDASDLAVANGLVLGSSYGTIPLGAGAFAIVAALVPHRGGVITGHPYALVFWIDAATYLVSFAFISRLAVLGPGVDRDEHAGVEGDHGFRAAFRIPLVRTVMPAVVTVSLGLGALFSLGVAYVRDVLHASSTQFGLLIALFGVGAGGGLAALRPVPQNRLVVAVRLGVACQGATIAVMSLAHTIVLALLGAAVFGGATAFTLAAGMSALQEALDGEQRVLAFAAFHVVIRGGLALAAIGAGLGADLVGSVKVMGLGTLSSASLVLFASGITVFAASNFVRQPVRVASSR